MMALKHQHACDKVDKLQKQLSVLNEEGEHLLLQIKEIDPGLRHFNGFQEVKNQLVLMLKERDQLLAQNNVQQNLAIELRQAKANIEELKRRIATMDVKMHNDAVSNNNEKAKLRMRLRTAQAKLDAFRGRYKEAMDEKDFMNKKFVEASAKLKEQLAIYMEPRSST